MNAALGERMVAVIDALNPFGQTRTPITIRDDNFAGGTLTSLLVPPHRTERASGIEIYGNEDLGSVVIMLLADIGQMDLWLPRQPRTSCSNA
jgi:hypothetical protein